MKFIGIVGSRRRDSHDDYNLLLRVFDIIYQPDDCIVSGGCWKGADRFAEMIAAQRGISMLVYSADWEQHGRIAGFLRNTDIANTSDVLIALPAPDRTGGTEDTITKFLKTGRRLVIV